MGCTRHRTGGLYHFHDCFCITVYCLLCSRRDLQIQIHFTTCYNLNVTNKPTYLLKVNHKKYVRNCQLKPVIFFNADLLRTEWMFWLSKDKCNSHFKQGLQLCGFCGLVRHEKTPSRGEWKSSPPPPGCVDAMLNTKTLLCSIRVTLLCFVFLRVWHSTPEAQSSSSR